MTLEKKDDFLSMQLPSLTSKFPSSSAVLGLGGFTHPHGWPTALALLPLKSISCREPCTPRCLLCSRCEEQPSVPRMFQSVSPPGLCSSCPLSLNIPLISQFVKLFQNSYSNKQIDQLFSKTCESTLVCHEYCVFSLQFPLSPLLSLVRKGTCFICIFIPFSKPKLPVVGKISQ